MSWLSIWLAIRVLVITSFINIFIHHKIFIPQFIYSNYWLQSDTSLQIERGESFEYSVVFTSALSPSIPWEPRLSKPPWKGDAFLYVVYLIPSPVLLLRVPGRCLCCSMVMPSARQTPWQVYQCHGKAIIHFSWCIKEQRNEWGRVAIGDVDRGESRPG